MSTCLPAGTRTSSMQADGARRGETRPSPCVRFATGNGPASDIRDTHRAQRPVVLSYLRVHVPSQHVQSYFDLQILVLLHAHASDTSTSIRAGAGDVPVRPIRTRGGAWQTNVLRRSARVVRLRRDARAGVRFVARFARLSYAFVSIVRRAVGASVSIPRATFRAP